MTNPAETEPTPLEVINVALESLDKMTNDWANLNGYGISDDEYKDLESFIIADHLNALPKAVEALKAAKKELSNAAGWATTHDHKTCGQGDHDPTPCAGCFAMRGLVQVASILKPLLPEEE